MPKNVILKLVVQLNFYVYINNCSKVWVRFLRVSRAHQGCSKLSYLSVSAIIETLLVTRCYSKQHASKRFKDLKGLHYSLQTSQKDLPTHSSSIFQTFSQVD